MSADAGFTGSIPAIYDRCLGPMLFEPYAIDLADRTGALRPQKILETAAGTGIVTARICEVIHDAEIVATDLNQAMLDVAASRVDSPLVQFRAADAQDLPFADQSFDMLVCQFGFMFFPDRARAYREARRVLKDGGHLLFNVWDRLDRNPASAIVTQAVAALFPADPPSFLRRVPFGYGDTAQIEADVRMAGFAAVRVETVALRSAVTAEDAAEGLCQGTPLRFEIEERDASRLDEATAASAKALRSLSGSDALDLPMSAHVITAAV